MSNRCGERLPNYLFLLKNDAARFIVESSQSKVSANHFESVPSISLNSVSSGNSDRMLPCSKLYLVQFLHIDWRWPLHYRLFRIDRHPPVFVATRQLALTEAIPVAYAANRQAGKQPDKSGVNGKSDVCRSRKASEGTFLGAATLLFRRPDGLGTGRSQGSRQLRSDGRTRRASKDA